MNTNNMLEEEYDKFITTLVNNPYLNKNDLYTQ